MEDINAKRDVRRRRILENSERRLLKITGRNNNTELGDLSSQSSSFIAKDIQKESIQPDINGVMLDGYSSRHKNASIFKSNDIWNYSTTCKHNDTRNEIENIHGTPTNSLLVFSLTNRVNYVLLAIIVNILLALQLDHLFGKMITIPCFPIILGRIYSQKSTGKTEDGNLLYTALILCNIKPKLTHKFKKFVTLIYMILEDLALYIFSFILIHCGLFYYHLQKTDVAATFSE
ncbi:uncharacterized protein LOC143177796 [Calliopsis andreniformis]|uniref:uncharacterized protein LOC143177796 n=1 Tax=Calliopsis andreniformis TaxID=337506 RepID=UPI003FCEBF51